MDSFITRFLKEKGWEPTKTEGNWIIYERPDNKEPVKENEADA